MIEDQAIWSAAYSPDGTTVAGGVAGDEANRGASSSGTSRRENGS